MHSNKNKIWVFSINKTKILSLFIFYFILREHIQDITSSKECFYYLIVKNVYLYEKLVNNYYHFIVLMIVIIVTSKNIYN